MFGGLSLAGKAQEIHAEQVASAEAAALAADMEKGLKLEDGERGDEKEGLEEKTSGELQCEGKMTREQILRFFELATKRMEDAETRLAVARDTTPGLRPSKALVDKQTDVLEAEMGIAKEFGLANLAAAPHNFPGDPDITASSIGFQTSCQEAYIGVLQLRRPKDEDLKKEGSFSTQDLMEFFDACDTLMALRSTQDRLTAEYKKTNEPPNALIIEMQKDMLACLGWDREYGVSYLQKLQAQGMTPQVGERMRLFATTAHNACNAAVMGPEKMKLMAARQRIAMEREIRMRQEVGKMSAKEKRDFVKEVMPRQVEHAKVMQDLDEKARFHYATSLSESEQEELAKLRYVMESIRGNAGGHVHGPNCNHNHSHNHGHSHDHSDHSGHGAAFSHEGHDHSHAH